MSTSSATTVASDIQMDYMNLLVTQLKYQNPLEPLDNSEMASQLALFTQIEQLEAMNGTFEEVLTTVERNYASSLIGKEVWFSAKTDTDTTETLTGTVDQIYHDSDDEILLAVGDYIISLGEVISVGN
jgi:flagellar basal-body rod modification protein FlgD